MASESVTQDARLINDPGEIRQAVAELRASGVTVGLVPTMGALHEGHLSLARAARDECDVVVVTIFVNPTQFGPGEDFSNYPRDLGSDLQMLAAEGVDLVFAPADGSIYSPGHDTTVVVDRLAREFEGRFRPSHFGGVTTVVTKLFQLVPADVAFFGQKDYQQQLVIRRMTADLDLPIEIRTCPTVREADGLAMSSRNAYLSPEDRQRAAGVYQSLAHAQELVAGGETDTATILASMRRQLKAGGIDDLDYVAIADAETLAPTPKIEGRVVALIAARVGQTRLIDNLLLTPAS